MKKIFTLIGVAVLAIAAQANVLTVCDAGYEDAYYSSSVPIYGLWVDADGTMAQSIYPADMLTDMVGSEITELKFTTTAYWYETYIGEGESAGQYGAFIAFENAKIQLSLKVVDEFGFDSPTAFEDLEVVATAVPVKGEDHMTFVLDEPFVYEGGNLLVECKVIEVGSYGTTYFLGAASEYTSSYYAYGYSSMSEYTVDFLPMATFTYEPTETPEVGSYVLVVVDAEGVEHFFNLSEGSDGNYTTTLSLDYNPYFPFEWDPTLTDEENKAAHPVNFYFLVNDERYGVDGEVATVMGYALENPLATGVDGFYTVPVGNAYTLGLAIFGDEYYVYAAVANPTGINELANGKDVAGVRYFNMAGQEMKEANGMTIVVTTYTDGTSSAVKVIK